MKAFTTLGFLLLLTLTAIGQIVTPVSWEMSQKHIGGSEFELIFTAKIDDGWKIYSQYLNEEDGPIPTSFIFEKGTHYEQIGKTEESEEHKKTIYDPVFSMNLTTFSEVATFTQKVKVSDLSKPIVGYLEFMTCDATRCLPPAEEDFSFKLVPVAKTETGQKSTEAAEDKIKTTPNSANTTTSDAANRASSSLSDAGNSPQKEASKIISPPQPVPIIKQAGKIIPQTTTPIVVEKTKAEEPEIVVNRDEDPVLSPVDNLGEVGMVNNYGNENSGILDPVAWTAKIENVGSGTYDLTFTAKMDEGWYIYSQHTQEGGPIPTGFYFKKETHYELLGEAKEIGKIKEALEPAFGPDVRVSKFEGGKAIFVQRVKVNDPNVSITGEVEYMACNNETCTPPITETFLFNPARVTASIGLEEAGGGGYTGAVMDKDDALIQDCGSPVQEERKGLWGIFGLGFLGGLLALLTPCVFPMIPLTVSFFTKGSENKRKGLLNALLYGFFIFMVYILLSVPFHLMDSINPDILNEISTNVWLNIAFFFIFLFFAFSFFGYYELTLPDKWVSKSSSAEGAGGVLGIFFMALTLALVSFSCTGPILGSLLAGALTSDGGANQLTAGMGGFGAALALPFALFALFPSMMTALPKSGGWLNTVKVTLGFLEVAAALKFLSNADLVSHWNILKVEPVLLLWILTFIGLGLYLFGKIKFPHDSPIQKLGIGRMLAGAASIAFAAYMATGFMYDKEAGSLKSLTLLSGFAPPACYSIFYPCDCPQNLNCFKDFDQGVAYAKQVNKPILLDFTGYACVNCRKMEEHVWPQEKVYDKLKEKYVLISLYVDDKTELPLSEQVEVLRTNGTKRKLRTYGHKWAHFQTDRYQSNTQPYYVLLTSDGQKRLNNPVGYTPEAAEYSAFLECGLEAFRKYEAIGMK